MSYLQNATFANATDDLRNSLQGTFSSIRLSKGFSDSCCWIYNAGVSPQQNDFVTDVLAAVADDSSYLANAYTGTFHCSC